MCVHYYQTAYNLSMPYYKIIISFKTGRIKQGIRQLELKNIDVVYNMIVAKVKRMYRENDILYVDVYMLSKNCREVKGIR